MMISAEVQVVMAIKGRITNYSGRSETIKRQLPRLVRIEAFSCRTTEEAGAKPRMKLNKLIRGD